MRTPATLGACIDLLYATQEKRLALERSIEKKVEALRKEEQALEKHLLDTFSKDDLDGAKGKRATAGLKRQTVPNVKDWEQLYKFIKKHDAFELLQRRVSGTAYRERLEAKEVIPGVEAFTVVKLSLTKKR